MPKYINNTIRYQGGDFLKIPPNTDNYKSIFYYPPSDTSYELIDEAPYYNPVKKQEIYSFDDVQEFIFEIPDGMMGSDSHIVIYTQCDNLRFDAIEVMFNSKLNTPPLPLTNSEFSTGNFNRVKRIFFNTKADCTGSILVMVVDKYVPAQTSLNEDSSPARSAGN